MKYHEYTYANGKQIVNLYDPAGNISSLKRFSGNRLIDSLD